MIFYELSWIWAADEVSLQVERFKLAIYFIRQACQNRHHIGQTVAAQSTVKASSINIKVTASAGSRGCTVSSSFSILLILSLKSMSRCSTPHLLHSLTALRGGARLRLTSCNPNSKERGKVELVCTCTKRTGYCRKWCLVSWSHYEGK